MYSKYIFKTIIILSALLIMIGCGIDKYPDNNTDSIIGYLEDNTIPGKPTGLRLYILGNYEIKLKWSADKLVNVTGFNIYRKIGDDAEFIKINNILVNDITYNDKDSSLNDQTNFYYTVTAVSSSGIESARSDSAYILPAKEKPIIIIDGEKDEIWQTFFVDTDPIDAPFDKPQELTDFYITDDTESLYFGWTYYKSTWGADDIHFGIAIDINIGDTFPKTAGNDPWNHSGISYDANFVPEIITYISGNQNDGIHYGSVYYDYTTSFKSIELVKNDGFAADMITDDTGWIEVKIIKSTVGLANMTSIKCNLWCTQEKTSNQVGVSDVIPGSDDKIVRHDENIEFDEYITYNMGY